MDSGTSKPAHPHSLVAFQMRDSMYCVVFIGSLILRHSPRKKANVAKTTQPKLHLLKSDVN